MELVEHRTKSSHELAEEKPFLSPGNRKEDQTTAPSEETNDSHAQQLFESCKTGNLDSCKDILSKGIDVNVEDVESGKAQEI